MENFIFGVLYFVKLKIPFSICIQCILGPKKTCYVSRFYWLRIEITVEAISYRFTFFHERPASFEKYKFV